MSHTRHETTADDPEANVWSSLMVDSADQHLPCFDVDSGRTSAAAREIGIWFPGARWVQSSTAGHWHVYWDVPITWAGYLERLDHLARLGVVENGYVAAARERGATFVRKPGVVKVDAEDRQARRARLKMEWAFGGALHHVDICWLLAQTHGPGAGPTLEYISSRHVLASTVSTALNILEGPF